MSDSSPRRTPPFSSEDGGSSAGGVRSETCARSERRGLADLLLERGSDAPTLCEGWLTRDLAVHLVLRENRPDAIAGLFLPFASSHLEKVSQQYRQRPYADLVEQFRRGAPLWNLMRWADRFVNLAEYFIHHEDVRRAPVPGQPAVAPRVLPEEMRRELWRLLAQMARVFVRPVGARVVLEARDSSDGQPLRCTCGASQGPEVVISGPVSELVLWLYGRDSVAEVQVSESQPGAIGLIQRRRI